MPPDVKRSEVETEVRRALGASGGVVDVSPLLKGHGHQSFVVRTGTGASVLLKIALRREQLDKMRSLSRVLELTARHGIPAPRVLYFSAGTASFDGRPWLVQEFLPGDDGETALAGMAVGVRAGFFEDFGRAVARLHAIDVGYFAEDLAGAAHEPTWAAAVTSRLGRLQHEHRGAGVLSPAALDAAAAAILSDAHAVSPHVGPALVHRDLYLPNTLVADGRFRGLLDFEHARSGDAVSDFVKLAMWVFEPLPGSASAFCSGYGGDPLTTDEGRRRHRLALGLELLAGLLYWRKTGDGRMLADYQRRLEPWLAAG